MLAIEVRCLSGRYHATPWGRHANEGVAEWPPSPWRLLRALYSAWKEIGGEESGGFEELVRLLALCPPQFSVPAWSTGHTRHYPPVGELRQLCLDAFVAVDPADAALTFLWPEVLLTAAQEDLLDLLLSGIGYLGRSESLAELTRGEGAVSVQARPLEEGEDCWDLVHLLCPQPALTPAQLGVSTAQLRRQRRNLPPGAQWVPYRWLDPERVRRPSLSPCLLEFRLTGPRPFPGRETTLTLAHRTRQALLALGRVSATLTGKQEGKPRRDGHAHLHVLPDGAPDGDALTGLFLWAPEGFGPGDLEVLGRFRGTSAVPMLPWGCEVGAEEVFGISLVWRSYTPYLMARHPRRQRDGAAAQICRECVLRALPEPEVREVASDGRTYQVRRGPGKAPPGPPCWFELTFPRPVLGPLCLGASCHFGMGRFIPAS